MVDLVGKMFAETLCYGVCVGFKCCFGDDASFNFVLGAVGINEL